ncbi:uncharacterized protein EV154DRAFT_533015 [Mucor mucedo]|uniref:uncharacterized protein n=1 Tax=Mucor mucedo TaxID=29922 RepID=UPI0022204349|nr:uncharacterized protein EV154DRAFT_533015 [Mucor mucedo]KAI7865749.1 hypothetical protein EV154DRAFT_533015 [Mucor mucedo]
MRAFMEMHEGEVFLHGVNLLWSSVFHKLIDAQFEAPCFKFVKPTSSLDLDGEMTLPHDLKLTKLEHQDIQKVHSSNKVTYDIKYIEDCFRLSSAIRRVDNDELAAWTMTHRDFAVGALYVLPEYRRKGYAEVILHDVCKQHVAFYKQAIPEKAADLYFSATVEYFNTPSANLFKKTGWVSLGLGRTWIAGSPVGNK